MGNSKSKKQKEPDRFFEREKWKEDIREVNKKKNINAATKRNGVREVVLPGSLPGQAKPVPAPVLPPDNPYSYDDEALKLMRYQLHNDINVFLMNNILLSVQFFENYEKEAQHIKSNPLSEREHHIDEAMVKLHKHVFFADRLQECIHEHVCYQQSKDNQPESLITPRLFVIYDNVEVIEPGETEYSAVLDAPFYKLCIEDCKEPGYVKLKKREILESTLTKEVENSFPQNVESDDSIFTDSEKESIDSDEYPYASKGEALLNKIKSKINENQKSVLPNIQLNTSLSSYLSERRGSGPVKFLSLQASKSNISNINNIRSGITSFPEVAEVKETVSKPRKSILKNRGTGDPMREIVEKTIIQKTVADDTETSGYRSTSSSRQNETSETDSEYGYSTITESTTPKKLELSDINSGVLQLQSANSGVVPDDCWTTVSEKAINGYSDDENEDDTASNLSLAKKLYDTFHYLNSLNFMNNFVDNFIVKVGSALGMTEDAVKIAMTQGASIYCINIKNNIKVGYEVVPAIIAAWPNAANLWIIRERRIIINPRNNYRYQWPTKHMVNKAVGYGCLLIPIGFRPKRGTNIEQKLQWKITFPAAERYLESSLAHSPMRCYLFALALHKTFLENDKSKIGLDAGHIKNHLFWQCENNYASWPEDRLGETLLLFLKNLYNHLGKARLPNYFVENHNEFQSIPQPLMLKFQRKLAYILETPVMHMLYAIERLKYTKKDFYPKFNVFRLYQILTCKNPLRLINPNLPLAPMKYNENSGSDEDEQPTNIWDRAKNNDKHYKWKKEKQRQMTQRRKATVYNKKQKALVKSDQEINTMIVIPKKIEPERRQIILEFFIPHFIAMARSSEKFEAYQQALLLLEQAKRLCLLLLEEPGVDNTANEYLDVVYDKLADCQRKLVNQKGFNLPPRRESQIDRASKPKPIRKLRPKYENIISQDSPTESTGIQAFTFVDIHIENSNRDGIKLSEEYEGEESKL